MPGRALLMVFVLAVGLTVLFWGPLWQGYGLIGGDLYTYFFPQKAVYAAQLAEGRIPLWNPLVGFGYPLLAESQAGVYYPPNPLLYRSFEINTAYNISQLGHYVLAFVATWLLMRRLDLSGTAATLASVVFVYGWFPPRICLEWAIIGGVYFPLALWCVESFLLTTHKRWLVALAFGQGAHLLAGHFNLAFITQLTCIAYVALRILSHPASLPADRQSARMRAAMFALVLTAIVCGFALAAIQIVPTWELKQLSQREGVGGPHDPGYGHIPPWYLSQIVAPWLWYPRDVDPDRALESIDLLSIGSSTNKVEAHLYFGMLPLLLIAYRLAAVLCGAPLDRRHRHLLWLGLAALIYTTGWLLPITRHLPGFRFFMGPGRYGIVTTLAAAVLAGAGLDRLLDHRRLRFRSLMTGLIIGLTLVDLHWVSRRVTYAVMVADPPIRHIGDSAVREQLLRYESLHPPALPVRMLAPGANLATLTGFNASPAYLGIGPAAYFDPDLMMPQPTDDMSPADVAAARAAQQDWLRAAAFTHILRMEPLEGIRWPHARLVWEGFDRLLNPAWGRREPLYLYELSDSLPRVRASGDATISIEPSRHGRMAVTAHSENGSELVWADLAYPGWSASIESHESGARFPTEDGLFRRVPLPNGNSSVVWEFSPQSHQRGAAISLVTLTMMLIVCGYGLLRRRVGVGAAAKASPPKPSA